MLPCGSNYALVDKKRYQGITSSSCLGWNVKRLREYLWSKKHFCQCTLLQDFLNKFSKNILFCIWCQPIDINYPLYFDTDCTTKSSVFFPFLSTFRIKCKF